MSRYSDKILWIYEASPDKIDTFFSLWYFANTMHNLIEIMTEPDNIAILIMLVSTITCTWVAFHEAMINDKLIKEGKKEKIYERMTQ